MIVEPNGDDHRRCSYTIGVIKTGRYHAELLEIHAVPTVHQRNTYANGSKNNQGNWRVFLCRPYQRKCLTPTDCKANLTQSGKEKLRTGMQPVM